MCIRDSLAVKYYTKTGAAVLTLKEGRTQGALNLAAPVIKNIAAQMAKPSQAHSAYRF